jgi:hypothetical protein
MSNFAPCHTEPKPVPHGLASLHWCNSIDLLGVALSDGTVTAYRWNETDGSKKDWKRMWSNTVDIAPAPAAAAADRAVSSRLLLWQPDGRAAAVVSSTSLHVLNVESGADIFQASLSTADGGEHRVVDGVWAQLSAAAPAPAAAATAATAAAATEDRELHFTDFLPPIPLFSEGGGASNGDEHDADADAAAGELPLPSSSASSSSSSSSKPSLSLIAVLDVRGHIR